MRIYTRKGDSGYSILVKGTKIQKSRLVFELLGTIDELNSLLGICILFTDKKTKKILKDIQGYIFTLGAYVSGFKIDNIQESININTEKLENLINFYDSKLPTLSNFILPGGNEESSFLHLSRAVCRRLERILVSCSRKDTELKKSIKYINRLSDLLFVLARYDNYKHGIKDVIWRVK